MRRRSACGWGLTLIVLTLGGCAPAPPAAGIIPDPALGRRAIEAAMASWRAGRPTGVVEGSSPRIQVVDTHRVPGQTLEGFEILSEVPDGRLRAFSIRLQLSGVAERPVVRYLAIGLDPVLIFRQEDHDLLMHWEHRMDPTPEAPNAPAAVTEPVP